jgi:DNA-binding SARP family transcriptional activator/pimeloyl-ACP methyl ester carboxylesterase
VEFRLLGPLEVIDGTAPLPVASGKQGALLALLLLNANRAVARDRIVDELWGDDAPDSAPKMVQIYVSQLRKLLPEPRLHTRPPGYAIEVRDDELDLARFERLLEASRPALAGGEASRAAAMLREALALWRGPALAEFSEPFTRHERARLEELRVAALEARIEAELALGRHAEVVGELESLMAKNPLREQLRSQHMLALYRSRRHAEALASYRAFRQALDDELGIEPTAELKELERRMLRQDAGLERVRVEPADAVLRAVHAVPRTGVGLEADVRYARSGDVRIAYQTVGDGLIDLVLVHGGVCTFQPGWENPRIAAFYQRLAAMGRLILFDKRGTGLSDRVSRGDLPDLETRMDDVRAVMDDAGSRKAVVIGVSEGGAMSALFAAMHPERTLVLVLLGTFARMRWAPDYPIGTTDEVYARQMEAADEDDWARAVAMDWLGRVGPALLREPDTVRWYISYLARGASPAANTANRTMNREIDIRDLLPTIAVPTLVLYRSREHFREGTRYMGEHIPGARVVELPGEDHLPWEGDRDALLDEIERFLPRAQDELEPDRVLATLLFTDLVGSTTQAAELGDRAWRDRIAAHHRLVRTQLARFRGREVDMAGDGVFATFDGPARAVRCASAIAEGLEALGLRVRAGVHIGEIEQVEGGVHGMAVHIAARIAAAARAGEVVVSSTVKDIVAGSGIAFEERGEHELQGVPGTWRLFAARV